MYCVKLHNELWIKSPFRTSMIHSYGISVIPLTTKDKSKRIYNMLTRAAGDVLPPILSSEERGGVYEYIRRVYDYHCGSRFNCIHP